jgi:2,3-bisphosphoglycerate-independent phosphoglycerate mutase
MNPPFKKAFLIVLDGFGLVGKEPGNAIIKAGMPALESYIKQYPALAVAASGLVVGLPWGQPGNSEVGHSAIGTGRIVVQDLAHINGEIRSGEFYRNKAFLEAIGHTQKHSSALHLIGCTSPGGIHSHVDHLIALLELAQRKGLPKIFVHFIADGQDMPAQDAVNVLTTLEPYLKKSGARIASVSGRSYAMDRVNNWTLTERVWKAITLGKGIEAESARAYMESSYAAGNFDYSLEPAVIFQDGSPLGILADNDAMIFFDFRNDRVRQLASPFVLGHDFKSFDNSRQAKNVKVVTMTKYEENFDVSVAYPAPELSHTLGEVIDEKGWKQWRIAEKEKEAHVTNFFNGGRIKPFKHESRSIASSRMMKGPEYIKHPEMSAEKIVDIVLEKSKDDARLYIINFANPDMIGHTGNLEATVKAMKITDDCLEELCKKLVADSDNVIIITGDHGNAEELFDPLTGGEDTQHSTRNVPAIFIGKGLEEAENSGKNLLQLAEEMPIGTLVDIAPSILYLLGVEKPKEMTGSRLITVK